MKPNTTVEIGALKIGNALPLTLIAGPCQLESRDHAFMMAGRLKEIATRLGIQVATVKNHVHSLLKKLQVHRRGEAAAIARSSARLRPPSPVLKEVVK